MNTNKVPVSKLNISKDVRIELFFILFGSVLLCFIGFYNKYPLVYSDTGTYLYSGFCGINPTDRPIFYGLFARHISLAVSPWLVIWVQGFLVSFLLFITVKMIFIGSNHLLIFLFSLVILVCFTGVSHNVSILIPDIFTSISLLTFVNLLINNNVKLFAKIFLSIVLILSLVVHLSNILIITTLCFLAALVLYLKKGKGSGLKIRIKRNLIYCSILIAISWFLIPSANYVYSNQFTISRGSQVFIMNHLSETGVLEEYLKRECKSNNFKICQYKDSLVWDFLWDSKSPLYKTGGWEANKQEYDLIIKDILSKPYYLKSVIPELLFYSITQYFNFDIEHPLVYGPNSAPYSQIHWHYSKEIKNYCSSRQNTGTINFDLTNSFETILVLFSLVFIFYFIARPNVFRSFPFELRVIVLTVISGTVINAIVTSNLSAINSRYQNRIIWLVPLIFILVSGHLVRNRKNSRAIQQLF